MRKLVALVLALVLALFAVPAMAEGKLVVYTPNPDAEIQYILNPFIEKYNVEVETMPMGTGECYTRLAAEKDAPIADVMFGGVESRIAQIIYGIPAVKGLDFGLGTGCAAAHGSESNDGYTVEAGRIKLLSNRCGGILGGITTGTPVIFRVTVKPTPSIRKPQRSVSLSRMEDTELVVKGRHDPCIVPRAVPVVEAAAAIAVFDMILGSTQTARRK